MSFPLINLILDKDIEEIIAEVPTNFKLKNKLISLGDSFWPSSLNYNDEIHQHILSISDEELEKLIKFYVRFLFLKLEIFTDFVHLSK